MIKLEEINRFNDKEKKFVIDNFTFGSSFIMNVEDELRYCDEVSIEFPKGMLYNSRVKIELKEIRRSLADNGYRTKLKSYLSKHAKYTTALDNNDVKYELIIYKK